MMIRIWEIQRASQQPIGDGFMNELLHVEAVQPIKFAGNF
jgi:hypothetical protein